MLQTVLMRVFKNGWYLSLTLAIFIIGISLILLLPNAQLISIVSGSEDVRFATKLQLILALYGSITTNFTLFSALYTLLATVLFAVNATLFIYYVRRAQKSSKGIQKAQVSSVSGLVAGLLGIGCAACGSVILSTVAISFGGASILALLPLHGGEFALIGIVLLSYSIYLLAKKIHDPLVCIPEA